MIILISGVILGIRFFIMFVRDLELVILLLSLKVRCIYSFVGRDFFL